MRTSISSIALVLVVSTVAWAQQSDDAQVKARQRISMMEGTLERAVKIGADNLLRRIRAVSQDPPMLSGVPEVRGFRLDGYGVFFDVEVPALRLPITWPLRYMSRDNRDMELLAADFRNLLSQVRMDPQSEELFAGLLRRMEARAQGPSTQRGTLEVSASQNAGATPPPIDHSLMDDPNEGYTQEVKAALIDAMIESSGPLTLETEEWLTVAARDNVPRDPLVPGDTADFSTVIFRLKGSDLAAFRSGRLTLEQTREKVEVREY